MQYFFRSRSSSLFLLLACGAAIPGLAAGQPASAPASALTPTPPVRVTENLIYTIPDDTKIVDTLVSPDNLHVGMVESKDEKYHVVVGNARGPAEEWVIRGSLLFSLEGGRFAYQTQKSNLMNIVVGQAGPQWNAVAHPGFYMVGRMLFSADGKRFAYLAQKVKDGKMHVVLDGKDLPEADEIFAADMHFSPNGKHFVYCARNGPRKDPVNPKPTGKQFYVLDGVPQPEHDAVARFTFGAGGDRWGYIARDGQLSVMVIDGKPTAKFPIVAGLVFTADGKKYAYAVESAGPDGKPSGKQSLIYNAGDGEKQFQSFDGIGQIIFSPDGSRLAMTTMTAGRWSVYVDAKPAGSYDGTGGMLFSPNSKRLAVVAGRDRRQFLVIDNKEYPAVDVVATAGFSPDSAKVASVVIQGAQRMIFLEDKRVGPATFFAFSPDSAWLGHALPASEGKWRLAIDGTAVGPEFDASPPGARLIWESPIVARVISGRGKHMYLVRLTLGAEAPQQ